jgi:hypothetical protein
MCAEAVPWPCHRSLIADAPTVRGIRVAHIMGAGRAQPHRMTAFAHVEEGAITYPELPRGGETLPNMLRIFHFIRDRDGVVFG